MYALRCSRLQLSPLLFVSSLYILKFPFFQYFFFMTLQCSWLLLFNLLIVTSQYYFFKVSNASLSICDVIALFSASAVSSSICCVTIYILKFLLFHYLFIASLLCSRLRLFHLMLVMPLSD